MDITIDKNLRSLRQKHGKTQEDLAEFLSLSPQAVSRWERGETMPDITFLPKIAAFYDVTVDDLLGVGQLRKQEKIHEYRVKSFEMARDGRNDERIEMWREAYSEFPNDMDVNQNLMIALSNAQNEKYNDEVIELGERILRESTNEYHRSNTIQILSRTHVSKGNKEKAEEYALMASGIQTSRNVLLSLILEGEKSIAQNNALMLDCLDIIHGAEGRLSQNSDNEKVILLKEFYLKMLELYFDDGYYGYFSLYAIEHHSSLTKLYLSHRNDEQKAFEHLKEAVRFAKQYDTLPDPPTPIVYTSTLMNGVQSGNVVFGIYPETECELLLESLGNADFDTVRDKEWFKEIEAEIRANITK